MSFAIRQVSVALAANAVMIVRRGDESMSAPMPSPPITSVTRQLSRRSVFEALLHRSPISRADLAKVTGLSKQTMSEVIDGFEQQGLVRQTGRTSGNVGRTAVLYAISPEG